MDVRSQRTPQADAIDAGLLFTDGPRLFVAGLSGDEKVDQVRPFDSRLDGDLSAVSVEGDDAIEFGRIEENRPFPELLAPHGMPAPCRRDATALEAGVAQCNLKVVDRPGLADFMNAGGVQLRLDVIDLDSVVFVRANEIRGRRQRECHTHPG